MSVTIKQHEWANGFTGNCSFLTGQGAFQTEPTPDGFLHVPWRNSYYSSASWVDSAIEQAEEFPNSPASRDLSPAAHKEANKIMQPGTSTMLTGKEAIQSFGWVLCRNRLPPPPKETPTWSILQNQILLWSLLRCCCVVGMLPRLSPDQPILGCRALDLQLCAPSGWMLTLQCPQVLMP